VRSAPRTLLIAGAVTAVLTLPACTGDASDTSRPTSTQASATASGDPLAPDAGQVTPSPGEPVPAPVLSPGETPGLVPTQPATAPLEELAQTDLGQYLVRPTGVNPARVQATVRELASLPGVQSAAVSEEGLVDLVFSAGSTPQQRSAALERLATLGEVLEGV
jgi:hypothetical protein